MRSSFLTQLLLGFLPICDVLYGADHADCLAIADDLGRAVQGPPGPVFPMDPKVHGIQIPIHELNKKAL